MTVRVCVCVRNNRQVIFISTTVDILNPLINQTCIIYVLLFFNYTTALGYTAIYCRVVFRCIFEKNKQPQERNSPFIYIVSKSLSGTHTSRFISIISVTNLGEQCQTLIENFPIPINHSMLTDRTRPKSPAKSGRPDKTEWFKRRDRKYRNGYQIWHIYVFFRYRRDLPSCQTRIVGRSKSLNICTV